MSKIWIKHHLGDSQDNIILVFRGAKLSLLDGMGIMNNKIQGDGINVGHLNS